ncbi:hypothetical protein MOZ60_08055 [Stecheria sp. CLA-KB-P133]|uniref:Apea-like HEPN domain-containing protein n=1 Tax=Grylomicrobium aquisgranensis TaxID=2926318 RepID=A0AB35U4L7_9FIRM|nr:hypothetical protein [Stecheria sp. CLA-KB-P133]
MNEKLRFTSLEAIYSLNGCLDGPYKTSLQIHKLIKDNNEQPKDIAFTVMIEQFGKRKITVSSEPTAYWPVFLECLYDTERLLMVFDGQFLHLDDIKFPCSNKCNERDIELIKNQVFSQRLKYFMTDTGITDIKAKLVNFQDVVTDDLFSKWQQLLDELGIIHQMYLYSICKSEMPIDIRAAFIVEMAEPLLELLQIYNVIDHRKYPHLKDKLKAVVDCYGKDIFSDEMKNWYDDFLQSAVNTRVNIMHVKREQRTQAFGGKQCAAFMKKFSLMYRVILLDLMGAERKIFCDRMVDISSAINTWMSKKDIYLS